MAGRNIGVDIDELDESAERDAARVRAEAGDDGGPGEDDGGDEEAEEPEPEAAEAGDDGGEEPGEDEGAEPTRREKRRERGRIIKQNEELRRELAELRASQQTMMQLMRQPPPAPPVDQGPDPLEVEYESSWNAQQQIAREYSRRAQEYASQNRQMPPDEEDSFLRRARAESLRQGRIAASMAARDAGIGPPQPQQPAWAPVIQHGYRDVIANPEARVFAESRAKYYMSQGQQMSAELYEKTLKEARAFVAQRNGASQRPTDAARARLSGRAAGAGASSGGAADRRRPGAITPDVVARNKDLRRMADTVYEHEPDERKRYRMFAEMQVKGEGA